MTMNDIHNQETNIIYVAIPMDNGDHQSAPTIFALAAMPAKKSAGSVEAEEKPTPAQSHATFHRAALLIAVGFLVTTLIAFGASKDFNGHFSYLRTRGGRATSGCWHHHNHGANNVASRAPITNSNEDDDTGTKEYKMDGWYAGNESHDGWHASTVTDDGNIDVARWMEEKEDGAGNESHDGWHASTVTDDGNIDVARWMEEKEDGVIPGLP
eukprot:CAMPEP_0201988846 /NCGR_PEP_ID=MMETSP0904-20121228/92542_1 /ASSEMBLY_ACC=CAM_ASM_000553 /TAXON_ID=420261 /ORGANISM="Thalassiosira antarctica, Strain CCMP982" /LENGTH=211 /DNA_ID=CAMNT_0048543037 /DNA_START=30 /DNA_END=666 /DNA_ORIENTATION=-